ncbi:hypothetical protein GCM10012275_53410 [Longimycelium tulufanense]|uniref:Uncharacterized protein n=1 Tax=Longimycelium tulufanense TaxID=907463 RepID=A0A8J3CHG9_9PSEU|nr:hypothetical protein [Longimycelium tulufanense]GGM76029.1 hypothetical protein GCM10012275_53410 [Longimycelium tulufanense]
MPDNKVTSMEAAPVEEPCRCPDCAPPATRRSEKTVADLADLVRRLHDDQHDGPMRFCHEACREADDVLYGGRYNR